VTWWLRISRIILLSFGLSWQVFFFFFETNEMIISLQRQRNWDKYFVDRCNEGLIKVLHIRENVELE
jgi:hypothetical protein